MSKLEILALMPQLILAFGSLTLLMIGAWWPRWKPLMFSGIAVALLAAVVAIFHEPAVSEVGSLFSTGPAARFFTVLWTLCTGLVLLLSLRYGENRRFDAGIYVALTLFAATGMSLLSAATSLFSLFLGLEAYTLVLYILIVFDRESPFGAEAGIKYLVPGAVATGFIAFGIALIYVAAGTFHLPEALTVSLIEGHLQPIALLGWLLIMAAVGFKISLVPFHLWTPDVYQGAPIPITALLATGSKGAVVAAVLGAYTGATTLNPDQVSLLWLLSASTMLIGTLCALWQNNIKRLLAYSSMVHMGYLLIGLISGTADGFRSVAFYLVVYTVASLGSFAILASFAHERREPETMYDLRGAGYRFPIRSGLLAFFLLSLAGLPPAAGFIGKFGLFMAAIDAGFTGLTMIGILASLISVYYYLRVVMLMFAPDAERPDLAAGSYSDSTVLLVCCLATLIFGIFPDPLLNLVQAIF